jgi:hypothetical protein
MTPAKSGKQHGAAIAASRAPTEPIPSRKVRRRFVAIKIHYLPDSFQQGAGAVAQNALALLGIAALIHRCDHRFIHHETRVLSDQVQQEFAYIFGIQEVRIPLFMPSSIHSPRIDH